MARKKKKANNKALQNTEEIIAVVEEIAPAFNEESQEDTTSFGVAEADAYVANMQKEGFAQKHKTVLVGIGCAFAGILLAGGIAIGVNGMQNQDRITAMEASQEVIAAQAAEHVHTWIPQTENHHIDAVTETILHPAVYEDVVVYHTVCNVCGTNFDGVAEEHKADTGHSYTTNVPKTESHLKTAEWTETVIIEDARDETVTTGVLCTTCGEQLNIDQAIAQGISVPEAQ